MRGSPRSRWTAVALVSIAILVVSMVPIPGAVPEEGGGIPTSVLFHFVGYGVLAALLAVSVLVEETRDRASLTGAFGASAYGILIECLQYPIPYRSFSYLDMLVNGLGATVGVLLAWGGVLVLSDDQ